MSLLLGKTAFPHLQLQRMGSILSSQRINSVCLFFSRFLSSACPDKARSYRHFSDMWKRLKWNWLQNAMHNKDLILMKLTQLSLRAILGKHNYSLKNKSQGAIHKMMSFNVITCRVEKWGWGAAQHQCICGCVISQKILLKEIKALLQLLLSKDILLQHLSSVSSASQ